MQVVTVNSEKGGTGKTTIAVHVAGLLATMGKRVLLIDADPQGNATLSFGLSIYDADGKRRSCLYDVMVRGVDITEALLQPEAERYAPPDQAARGSLYVLPGNTETHSIATQVQHYDALSEVLEDVSEFFDVCIVDTAPSPGLLLQLVYSATHSVLIPTELEMLSLDGLMKTVQYARRQKIKLMAIQPNKTRGVQLHTYNQALLQQEAERNGWQLWQAIELAVSWAEASQQHRMVYSLEKGAGVARKAAFSLAQRVLAALEADHG
jgi:cellulose biosynthesis protein BcsQ